MGVAYQCSPGLGNNASATPPLPWTDFSPPFSVDSFVNISQSPTETVSSGTFTAGGLEVACDNGRLRIITEGRFRKFRDTIAQVFYSVAFAAQEGRQAVLVTDKRPYSG